MEQKLTNIKRFFIILICVMLPFIGFGIGFSIATLGISAYCDTDLFSTYISNEKGMNAIRNLDSYKATYIYNYSLVFGTICAVLICLVIITIFLEKMIEEAKKEKIHRDLYELFDRLKEDDEGKQVQE